LFKVLLDTNAPTVPTNLQGTPQSATAIKLTWNASSDPQSGIDHYTIYRDNVEVGTSSSLSFTNTGLLPGTSYSFKIAVVNGEGLESAQSSPVPVNTLNVPSPRISRIELTNGLVTVTWESVIGGDYQLMKTTNLNSTNWTNVGGTVNANATEASATDSQSTNSTFYRVRALP
jgi:chitodextrinase